MSIDGKGLLHRIADGNFIGTHEHLKTAFRSAGASVGYSAKTGFLQISHSRGDAGILMPDPKENSNYRVEIRNPHNHVSILAQQILAATPN